MKNKNFWGMAVAVSILLLSCLSNANGTDYSYELVDKKITFAWKVDGDSLAVKLVAETDGWIGIGFNPIDKMMGANFILGYVKDGKAKIVDEYGTKETQHKSDKKLEGSVDATLIGGTEIDGKTTIEFVIPLDSGDKNDTKIDVDGDTIVLLGYGAGRDSFRAKHKYRSTWMVNLSSGVSEKK